MIMKQFVMLGLPLLALLLQLPGNLEAQEEPLKEMTREDVRAMTYDELVELPLPKLMKLAEIVGVPVDELYDMVLKPDQSIASKAVESTFESPLSTSVISREQIMNSGAMSIPEALRLAPGVIVREKTPGNFDVHLRGLDNIPPNNLMLYSENSITLVMIDNRVIYNYAHGGTLWETLPISVHDIARIEVMRGPASTLYGSNAVSGVINIVTKEVVNPEFDVDVHAEGGYPLGTNTNINAKFGPSKDLKFRISGNYQHFKRTTNTFYMWPFEGYYARDSIDAPNPDNNGLPIKPHLAENYFPNPDLAKDRYGINFYGYYTPTDDINIRLSAGNQHSEIISSIIDDSFTSYSRRLSTTNYVDVHGNVNNFKGQVYYTQGTQDISKGSDGTAYDMDVFHGKLEYDLQIGDHFRLLPRVNYQWAAYEDDLYVADSLKEKYPNAENNIFGDDNKLYNMAASLRADYTFGKGFRLIGAVRNAFYNHPDDSYLSYQFIASYNHNDKHLLRAVYSTANRGPFMADIHTNYDWYKVPPQQHPGGGLKLHFDGNENLDLLTQEMYEIGYRNNMLDKLMFDIEAFRSNTKNFASLMPDYVHFTKSPAGGLLINPQTKQPIPDSIHIGYANLDVSARQLGISGTIGYMLSKKLYAQAYATYQETDIYDTDPRTTEEMIDELAFSAAQQYAAEGQQTGGLLQDKDKDIRNKATPSFYGGFMINYKPNPRWKMNLSSYFYTAQTFNHKHGTDNISSKFIPNVKIAYNAIGDSWFFVNARNFLDSSQKEFAFMDDIGAKYFAGFHIQL